MYIYTNYGLSSVAICPPRYIVTC